MSTYSLPRFYSDSEFASHGLNSGTPEFDADRYMHYVEDFGMTEDRKKEYLRTLWWIMAAFVNLGFGVDSVTRLFAPETSENGPDELQE